MQLDLPYLAIVFAVIIVMLNLKPKIKGKNVPVRRHSNRHAGGRFLIGTVMPNSEYNQPERFERMSTQKSEI